MDAKNMKTALTIAGSDSSGGAGIQADIKTMTANGVFALCAVTALTAQNTTGVTDIFDSTPHFLAEQLDAVFTDIFPDAVKIGMVSSAELIKTIAAKLKEYGAKHIVVDPVMVATSGAKLLRDDAVTALCEKLHVSADYVLLGKEPGEGQTAAYEPPDTCPCCGRKVSGSICPECGYQLPNHPPRGPQYAVVATRPGFVQSTESSAQLVKYCGFTQEDANNAIAHYVNNQSRILLRRGLVDSAAQYIAAHLDQDFFCPQIVVDCGESEEALLYKPKAFETPSPVKSQEGIGFWGVVGAVIVALLILSFF